MQRRQFLKAAGATTSWAAVSPLISHNVNVFGAEVTETASGPLRAHRDNARYFQNAQGQVVLLTGAHTWNNLVDMGRSDPPEPFDFTAYLDFLDRYGHNFIRLWTWDSTTWDTRANRGLGKDFVHIVTPLPWKRVGPGKALDGKPKFDLTTFDPRYFERLRGRVRQAGQRGIYVSIMLFEGWGLMHGNRGRAAPAGWAWRSHPFHSANNDNGVDAGVPGSPNVGKPHSLGNDAVNDIQTAYIRHVVDSVNDLDNVLYEVINEGGEQAWDWWVVKTLRSYEATKPKQHPIGITGHGAEDLKSMLDSPADWISPGSKDGFKDDPPAWNGSKVSLLDTDHVWGVGGNGRWVWKAFLRGHNPLFMDPYDGSVLGSRFDAQWEPVYRNMGHVRRLSERLDLAKLQPHDELASSKYCLANPGTEYLVWVPRGETVEIDLRHARGDLSAQWLNCNTGEVQSTAGLTGGWQRTVTSPIADDAVLHLRAT